MCHSKVYLVKKPSAPGMVGQTSCRDRGGVSHEDVVLCRSRQIRSSLCGPSRMAESGGSWGPFKVVQAVLKSPKSFLRLCLVGRVRLRGRHVVSWPGALEHSKCCPSAMGGRARVVCPFALSEIRRRQRLAPPPLLLDPYHPFLGSPITAAVPSSRGRHHVFREGRNNLFGDDYGNWSAEKMFGSLQVRA